MLTVSVSRGVPLPVGAQAVKVTVATSPWSKPKKLTVKGQSTCGWLCGLLSSATS
jgi:hypothetical protein